MALRRSSARLKHFFTDGANDYVTGWENTPPLKFPANVMKPCDYSKTKPIPKHWKLRGSGIHGPENTDLMKLVLWNRLKQKRPQREVPNINYLKDSIRLELSVNWWLMSKLRPSLFPPFLQGGIAALAYQSYESSRVACSRYACSSTGCIFLWGPWLHWGQEYQKVHEQPPWAMKRIDGLRGEGYFTWFLE
ncbi:hypothetical protein FOZ62_001369 [Perkinsus olseni]|uniref:Uncharacterized protein n=1 Tax=Perkinsus olseni TaxID=32597 RepID=A0A7J6Q3I6_PEROL|nr:hypothetical protein FOZ62_001369 [Perkinsus olseni]